MKEMVEGLEHNESIKLMQQCYRDLTSEEIKINVRHYQNWRDYIVVLELIIGDTNLTIDIWHLFDINDCDNDNFVSQERYDVNLKCIIKEALNYYKLK